MINWKQNTIEETGASLKTLLQNGDYVVKFTKVDGSVRTMKCTLRSELLPPPPLTEIRRAQNSEILSVWDTENSGWRSFKIANIISVEKI